MSAAVVGVWVWDCGGRVKKRRVRGRRGEGHQRGLNRVGAELASDGNDGGLEQVESRQVLRCRQVGGLRWHRLLRHLELQLLLGH